MPKPDLGDYPGYENNDYWGKLDFPKTPLGQLLELGWMLLIAGLCIGLVTLATVLIAAVFGHKPSM